MRSLQANRGHAAGDQARGATDARAVAGEAVSKPRVTTDEQDQALAKWYSDNRTVKEKAAELGISVSALYDAIARGQKRPTTGMRYKLAHAFDDRTVPRESPQNALNGPLATEDT